MKESANKTFNHFKVHTQYSICEGAIKIDQLKDFCKTNKIKSLGVSDTYNLSGALEFSETLSSVGTPSFYLSASDSSHGDLGSISKKDILILISYSGQPNELKNIIQYANRNKILLIDIVSKRNQVL